MKKISAKLSLLAIAILGIGTVVFTNASQIIIGQNVRETMTFISSDFWSMGPTDADITTALFGDTANPKTAYTQNRSGYTGECNIWNMQVYHVDPILLASMIPVDTLTIPDNKIFVLESGTYTVPQINIMGSCVAIIWSGTVKINAVWLIINGGQKIILDNVDIIKNEMLWIAWIDVLNDSYSAGSSLVTIANNLGYDINYTITGNSLTNSVTGTVITNNSDMPTINLTGNDGIKTITIIAETGTIFFNHIDRLIGLDTVAPTLTGKTLNNIAVTSGGVYNTGVFFTFDDANLLGAQWDGNVYTSGSIITGEGPHTITVMDQAWNSTGMEFTLDYTKPTFTGKTLNNITITSGGIYNTGFSFTFNDANLSWATLDGTTYTSGSIISTLGQEGNHTFVVTDKAGNTSNISFKIDATAPICGWVSPVTGSTVSGAYLKLMWSCVDTLAGMSGYDVTINDSWSTLILATTLTGSATGYNYYGESNVYNWKMIATDKAGNQYVMPFQKVTYIKPLIPTLKFPGNFSWNIYYVSGSTINLTLTGNMTFLYSFTGDTTTSGTSAYTSGLTVSKAVTLSGLEGLKTLTMNYWTGTTTGAIGPIALYLDTTNPNISGNYPTAWLATNQTGMNFRRTASDTGAGISGYVLKLDNIVIYSGSATGYTTTSITTGVNHTWTVSAIDYAGNIKITPSATFIIDTSSPTISGVINNNYYKTDVTPTFTSGTGILNGLIFTSGTPITGDGQYTLEVTNDVQNKTTAIFTIDKTNPTIWLISPTSGTVIGDSNTVTFLRNWSDANMSGYQFNLYGTYFTGFMVSASTTSVTLPNIPNNSYTWNVKAIDKAGNETLGSGESFKVDMLLTGTVAITGMATSSWLIYTNTTFWIQILANKNASVNIMGSVLSGNITDTIIGWVSKTISVAPVLGDGAKAFTIFTSSGSESFRGTVTGYLDTTAPSTPSFVGQASTYSGTCLIAWSPSSDAGVGMGDYTFAISSGSTILKSGISTMTGMNIANLEIGSSGNYTLYVAARDKLGNISTSGSMLFGYTAIEDKSPDSFSLTKKLDAGLNKEYKSDIITVSWLTTGTKVSASVDAGVLIINGSASGTGGLVQNGDKVQIALYSSQDYNDLTAWMLTIGDKYSTFKIATITENGSSSSSSNWYTITELSTTQKLHISLIYNALSELYSSTKQEDFMLSMKYLVKDKISQMTTDGKDTQSIETMKYLYNLINRDFAWEGSSSSSNSSSSNSYIAPNGKEYTIKFVSGDGYTSTKFVKAKYFDTRDEIETYIDKNNPKSVYVGGDYAIDQSRSSSPYTAPNGKVYNFFKTTTWKYGSNNFASAKLFDNIDTMKKHISVNNPK